MIFIGKNGRIKRVIGKFSNHQGYLGGLRLLVAGFRVSACSPQPSTATHGASLLTGTDAAMHPSLERHHNQTPKCLAQTVCLQIPFLLGSSDKTRPLHRQLSNLSSDTEDAASRHALICMFPRKYELAEPDLPSILHLQFVPPLLFSISVQLYVMLLPWSCGVILVIYFLVSYSNPDLFSPHKLLAFFNFAIHFQQLQKIALNIKCLSLKLSTNP